ncbi:MAG: NAD(P)/FAD-dependent oxidoreductase [Burkholderiales bacterium]
MGVTAPLSPAPHVVILGCGFGGLAAAKTFAGEDVRVTLIDRENHHLFQPLLYQVATAGLASVAIAAPIRHIFRRQRNVTTLLAEARAVDLAGKRVVLDDGAALAYDYLIVATGATHSYFGHDEWARFAPGLKTLDDAMEIRRQILLAYERAERATDPAAQRRLLDFVVVGGGATGVELAGTLAEIARHTLRDEFRRIDSRTAHVTLIEATRRVLPTYPEELSEKARRQLERLGVEVRTETRVTRIDDDGVWLGDQRLAAGTVVWAAGIAASPLARTLGVPLDRAGRVAVGPDLSVPDHPHAFVIGDLATVASGGKPVPGIAPAAKQMGRRAARNILARIAGRPGRAFRYIDYGSLATIGRNSGIAVIGPFRFWGLPAWLFWLFVHIFFLIGFRNRLMVFADWAWSYLTFARVARIVMTGESHKASE